MVVGTQFTGSVAANSAQRWFTFGWPASWNVNFKLHAPRNTIIEGAFRDGKLGQVKVTPESRRKDIVLLHE